MAQHRCPRCGAAIKVGQKFCGNCKLPLDPASINAFLATQRQQAPVAQPGSPQKPATTAKKRSPIVTMAIAAIVALCGLSALVGLVNRSNAKPTATTQARSGVATATLVSSAPSTPTLLPAPTETIIPTAPPTAVPVLQFTDTALFGNWAMSLGRIEARPVINIGDGSTRAAKGRWWLIWLDASNRSQETHRLSQEFEIRLADQLGLAVDDINTANALAASEGRDSIETDVPPGGLAHVLLAYDLPVDQALDKMLVTGLGANSEIVQFDLASAGEMVLATAAIVAEQQATAGAVAAQSTAEAVEAMRTARAATDKQTLTAVTIANAKMATVNTAATNKTATARALAACPPGARYGAKCNDGTRSDATGQGACSRHGGVAQWLICPSP